MVHTLVTGGTGFLGGHLVEALVARGERVRALVRSTSHTAHLASLGVDLVHGDLSDPTALRAALEGVEHIYHCAALVADWGGGWTAFRAANVTGLGNLLEAATVAGVHRFIHISTSDVYGYPNRSVDESAPHRLRGWPYGDTKIEGERLVWAYYSERGLPVTVVRPVTIYEPRSVPFVLEILDLLKRGSMAYIGDGRNRAGLAYVTNIVDLVLLAADSDQALGQAYTASDGSEITWRQYVGRLAEIAKIPAPRTAIPYQPAYLAGWAMEKVYGALHIQSRPYLTRMVVEMMGTDQGFSIEKARRELGYEPRVSFDEGMRRVEAWLQELDPSEKMHG